MTVWVLWHGALERVLGVYSTEERAKAAWLESPLRDDCDYLGYEPFEVDAEPICGATESGDIRA